MYKHAGHVSKQFDKYPRTKGGRRLTSMPLIPVVLNIFGQLNELAVQYFARVEKVARKRGRPFRAAPGGARSLAELASLLAVLSTASIVRQAFSQRRSEGHAGQGGGDAAGLGVGGNPRGGLSLHGLRLSQGGARPPGHVHQVYQA